jgi:hypothetical protein
VLSRNRRVRRRSLADLILVDGDPLPDLQVLAHPDRNLLVIMKNGTVDKSEPHTPWPQRHACDRDDTGFGNMPA